MTQLGLNLNRFEGVRIVVDFKIDCDGEQAIRDIRAMVEHQRRSLGQKIRWAEWRAAH